MSVANQKELHKKGGYAMVEIRSTMDIIMEKAKGLTMTDEEKSKFRQQEMTGKIRGPIQKFLDGTMNMERLKSEVTAIGEKDWNMSCRIILDEVKNRIEPERDNDLFFNILEGILGMETAPIRALLVGFKERLIKERASREKQFMEDLEKRGISGSAVLTNIDGDPVWDRHVAKAKEGFQVRLDEWFARL